MTLRITLASLLVSLPAAALADDPKPTDTKKDSPTAAKAADLTGYKTVKDAIKADPSKFKAVDPAAPVKATVPGFLGVEVAAAGKPAVVEVAPDSPAEKAGLKAGDVITKVGADDMPSADKAKDRLRGLAADVTIKVTVERAGKPVEVSVTPKAVSKPFAASSGGTVQPIRLGISNSDVLKDGGVTVERVTRDGIAEKGGIKEKDVLLQLDATKVTADDSIENFLKDKKAGDVVTALVKRDDKEVKVKLTLTAPQGAGGGRSGFGAGWDDRLPSRAWSKPTYKLAVIGIEYPDQKHNPKITDKDWEKSLFSVGEYTDKSVT
ncbi:MAG: PDZ domain-containing protein, partial [Gemmataceae bacterium]